MDSEDNLHNHVERLHVPQGLLPKIIFETQLNPCNRNKGNTYKDIMANIGLDSPTSSREERGREDIDENNQGVGGQLINTPIRSSAASLMALGQHVLTQRQGRMWEFRSKSPLGGQ